MDKLTESLDFVTNLSNQPTESADELKRVFDKAGNKIKEYLNNIVVPEVEKAFDEISEKAGATELTALSEELTATVNTKLSELQASVTKDISSIQSSVNSTNSTVSKKAVYSDFVITRSSYQSQSGGIVSTSSRNADLYHSVSKSGYYPIALVGVRGTSTKDKFDYRHGYLSNQANGSCIAHWIFTNNEGGSYNANDLPACEVEILWVRVR